MIRAYVGLPGSGKTFSLIKEGIDLVRAGRKVYTNVPFRNFKRGLFDRNYKKQPKVVTTKELEELILKEDDCTFLVDEGNIVFPAYYWKNLSPEFLIRLSQTRHHRLDLFYTSQGFTHVVARLRELTNEIVRVRSKFFFGKEFFIQTCYDPETYKPVYINEFEERRARVWQKRVYWGEAKMLFKAYDTFRDVQASSLMGVDYESTTKSSDDFGNLSRFDVPVKVLEQHNGSITTLVASS